jgi:hypothetical protein
MNKSQKPDYKAKIEIVAKTLKRRTNWYTGISIKKYLKKYFFSLKEGGFGNKAINSGRWSAYAHYSELKAFQNLLDKNHITQGSKVLIHPLLPESFVDELFLRGVDIQTIDISKHNLQFPEAEFISKVEQMTTQGGLDLVIHYGFNGLYEYITKATKYTDSKVIPSLILIDNFDLNLALLNLFESLGHGSILWSFGDSFLDEQLEVVLDEILPSQPWFVSWHIENRTRSILEYHLSESFEQYVPMVQAYLFLLAHEQSKGSLTQLPYKYFVRYFYLNNKIADPKHALIILKQFYNGIFEFAVPDFVFDLQDQSPEKFVDGGRPEEVIESSHKISAKARDLFNYFTRQISLRPTGSLEVPEFYLDKSYLKYFIYTTEMSMWYQQLQKNYMVEKLPPLHPKLFEKFDLPVARYVAEYLLLIDVAGSV